MRKLALLSLLATALVLAPAAHADAPLNYTFTVTSLTDPTFSTFVFTLPASPTPGTGSDTSQFTVSTGATVTTSSGTSSFTDTFEFYDDANGGGFTNNNLNYGLSVFSPQLFSGSVNAPTFLTGDFNLQDGSGATAYTLDIAPVAATPEPSSLVLLGTGVLGMAGAARRRFVK